MNNAQKVREAPVKKTAKEKLAEYQLKSQTGHSAQEETNLQLRRLLAARSSHLPGHNWCQDWTQWMRNNHPLIGLCFRYKENPIGLAQRLVILIGSISFGLAATNIIYLFYHIYDGADGTVVDVDLDDTVGFEITYEMIALWTLGGLLHSLIDLGVWHLQACACCLPGGCCGSFGFLRKLGGALTVVLATVFFVLAIIVVIMRANYETNQSANLTELAQMQLHRIETFSFLMGYGVELFLAYFFYYPLVATVMFSGVLKPLLCCLGGRPGAVAALKEQKKKQAAKAADTFEVNAGHAV
jgi:hypothetical protein